MDRNKQVFLALKPKVKAYGFNRKELESVAANIANNLKLEENASEEEVNDAIEEAIERAIPFLELSQKAANRIVQMKNQKNDDDDSVDDKDDNGGKNGDDGKNSKKDEGNEALTKLLDAVTKLTGEVESLKKGNQTNTRKAQLEAILKDTGAYGKSTLKSFERMTFKDEDEFEEFLSEVKDNLAALNQERANQGLEKLGPPAAGGGKKTETEVLSDDEIKELAKQ